MNFANCIPQVPLEIENIILSYKRQIENINYVDLIEEYILENAEIGLGVMRMLKEELQKCNDGTEKIKLVMHEVLIVRSYRSMMIDKNDSFTFKKILALFNEWGYLNDCEIYPYS